MKIKDVTTKKSSVEALDEQLDTILLNEQDIEVARIFTGHRLWHSYGVLRPSTRSHSDWFDKNYAEIMN